MVKEGVPPHPVVRSAVVGVRRESSNRIDVVACEIDRPDGVVVRIGNEKDARGSHGKAAWFVEEGLGGAAIVGPWRSDLPYQCAYSSILGDLAKGVVVGISDEKCVGVSKGDADGRRESSLSGGAVGGSGR